MPWLLLRQYSGFFPHRRSMFPAPHAYDKEALHTGRCQSLAKEEVP